MKTEELTPEQITAQLTRDGYSLQCTEPVGAVTPPKGKDGKPWLHVAYSVQLLKDGKLVWTGPYRIGSGHVPIPKRLLPMQSIRLTTDEESQLMHLQSKPRAQFLDRETHASLLGKLAKFQKVQPKLPDVLSSLLLDGSAFFDAQTFEDWCANFDCDTDSIEALETYRTCDKTGRELVNGLGRKEVDRLRELLSDW